MSARCLLLWGIGVSPTTTESARYVPLPDSSPAYHVLNRDRLIAPFTHEIHQGLLQQVVRAVTTWQAWQDAVG